jgi:hypothetical protein
MLMLRTVWGAQAFQYQLLEIPLEILSRMEQAEFGEVGTRSGRRSFGADVMDGGARMFRVHFDGADGKCQIHDLLVDRCQMLRQWQQSIE